ncbi:MULTISPECIES: glycosyltransferase [Bordetella]|uniref:Glycosyl transferase n=1 Tax=Bordetella genomosp. 6 TaxID=463024 RepID=A0ABX4F7Z2_9BORD|nr:MULTISPECIES: glycosyltransferase [Bordetella]AZW42122.1 glycosyl transferase [Bordetella bronchiseptica]OZI70444.1 glycosyl transferase [Bordetella genomosp. 6]
MRKISVAHLTSVHPRNDARIFLKQCRTLAAEGYDVSLVVADGLGDDLTDTVKVLDVGRLSGRLARITTTVKRVHERGRQIDADIYHLHDPELLPIGKKLKAAGKVVIFDSHEDVPKQILAKSYIGKVQRQILSRVYQVYEQHACRRFDAIVAATPYIRDKFLAINPRTVDVNNFPILGELSAEGADIPKKNQVCYVGGLERIRGIQEIVQAIGLSGNGVTLAVAGRFSDPALEAALAAAPEWRRVQALGWLGREGIRNVLNESRAGLVTLHPTVNYLDALPVKMFEYMSAGLPIIASDFPLWRSIVDREQCGICVDPLQPKQIAAAIDALIGDPQRAKEMGERGRKAVLERYNWKIEQRKLVDLYAKLAAPNAASAAH